MSYSLRSLKVVIEEIEKGTTKEDIKADSRSLD